MKFLLESEIIKRLKLDDPIIQAPRAGGITTSKLVAAVSNNGAITFGYEPVATSQNNLACFEIEDIHLSGEFNFVYCNEEIAREKIKLFYM